MDQFYFEEGYLVAGYLTVVKEASAGLTPYFVDGYLPLDYFGLEGNAINGEYSLSALLTKTGEPVFAIGTFASVISTSVSVNVIASGQSAITSAFTQTSTISHIEGADLTAFSNAQLEAAVRRIRDNNITASAAFSVAVDFVRTRNTASEEAAEFSLTAINARSRDYASLQSAAFSLAAAIDDRTRDQSSALASEFVFTVTISHIEGADLVAFSNAELTATPDKIKSVSVTLSSSATQSASAQRLRGGVANLLSSSSIFARPKFGVEWVDAVGKDVPTSASAGTIGGSIDNSVFKFGTGSLKLESSFNRAGIVATTNVNDLSIPAFDNNTTSNFSISFWVKGSGGGGVVYHLGNESLNLQVSVTTNSVGVTYIPLSGTQADYFTIGTNNLDIVDWNFIEVAGVYNSSGGGRRILNIYVNGVGQGVSVANDPNYAKLRNGLTVGNAMICSVAARTFWIDDFQYRVGTSAVIGSLPTSQAQGSGPSTTRTLLNLNGTFDDTNNVIAHSSGAELASITTVSANVDKFKFVYFEAALACSSSTSAVGIRVRFGLTSLASAFTQSADVARTRGLTSNQDAVFTQSTEAVKTANIVSVLDSQATFTGTISHIEGADLVAFSNSTLSADGVVTRSAVLTQSSAFTSTADILRVRFAASDINSAFTQSVDAVKTAVGSSTISSEAATSTQGQRVRFADSTLTLVSSLSATAEKVKVASAQLFSEFSTSRPYILADYLETDYYEVLEISAIKTARAVINTEALASQLTAVVKVAEFFVNSNVVSTLTADLTANKKLSADLSSSVSLTAVNDTLRGFGVILQVNASQSSIIGSIKQFNSSQASEFTVSVAAIKTGSNAVIVSSEFALSGTGRKLNGGNSTLAGQFAVQVNAIKLVSFASSQSAAFTQSASIDNRTRSINVEINSVATLTANVLAGKFAESNQSAVFTQTASALRLRGVDSSINSNFTVIAAVNEIVQLSSTIASEATLLAAVNRTASASSSQTAVASVTCVISHIEGADIVVDGFATLDADVDKIAGIAVTATSVVNLTASADKFRAFNANLAVSTALIVNAVKIHRGQAAVQAQATIQANATKIVQFSAVISSAMTFVAAVREIDAASLTQFVYTIAREDYVYIVPDEVPVYNDILYVIPNENWTYNITAETRVFPVDQETRIYNIRST